MELAGQTLPTVPVEPDKATRTLRARLILEEALETLEALGVSVWTHGRVVNFQEVAIIPDGHFDMVEVADGCADVSVVTIGTMLACGIDPEPVLECVDESNLAKFRPGWYRREDGKIMKPPGWQKPEIAKILQIQTDVSPATVAGEPAFLSQ
jgi:predicted HAD superfamily Cof-like phosphohydrolase